MEERLKITDNVELQINIGYEDLLLELKAYSSILEFLGNVVIHDANVDFSLIHYILSKKIDINCDLLLRYA